jgi:hypothetical protein
MYRKHLAIFRRWLGELLYRCITRLVMNRR